jgi:hypothetical protein
MGKSIQTVIKNAFQVRIISRITDKLISQPDLKQGSNLKWKVQN